MKRSIFLTTATTLVILFASACSLLGQGTPAPVSGTPNATLTALFDLSKPPTTTPPQLITATSGAPLPTVAPSSTPLPSATPITLPTGAPTTVPTTAPARSGPLMKAAFLTTVPKIDGSWSEWRDKTTQYPLSYVVFGAKNWSGQADLEASYAAAWDAKNLYVGFKIYDDKYVQNATGKNLYKGDSQELLIDTNLNGDLAVQELSADDFQLGLSCGSPDKGTSPEAYLWFPSGSAGSKTNVKIACTFESGNLYRVEAAIPWSILGVTPSSGLTMGFAASVNDNDDASQNVQQSMISTAKDRVITDPTTWGWINLVK